MTSQYEEEEESYELDDDLVQHPDDRVADAGQDDENIETDWSRPYSVEEEEVMSEIQTVQTINKPRPRLRRWNKVSFQDDPLLDIETHKSHVHTVFAELNPAALELERRLEKTESMETQETDVVSYENIDITDNSTLDDE